MVIVIDDFAVDSNTVQPKAKPAVPPVTPLYDDNTMYNATVYPGKQVSAPSAVEQPVVYQAPIWESATQTYRDPASGLLWLDDGTPGGQWVSDAAYTTRKSPAPAPPPVSSEDAYDFYRNPDWNTDADTYWQTYNPGKVENLMTEWAWDNNGPAPIYGPGYADIPDKIYEAKLREMASAGLLEPSPADLNTYLLTEQYNYAYPLRQHWNNKEIARLPYTNAAADLFTNTVPKYVGSGIAYEPPSSIPDKGRAYGYYSNGSVYFDNPSYPGLFAHERAHQWDFGRSTAPPPEPPYSTMQEFAKALEVAKDDPSVPAWAKNAIATGEHREQSGSGSRLTETYAHLAEYSLGHSINELPPYLRKFFSGLYTEGTATGLPSQRVMNVQAP